MRSTSFALCCVIMLSHSLLYAMPTSTQSLRVLQEFGSQGGRGWPGEHNLILDEQTNTLYGVNKFPDEKDRYNGGILFKINLLDEKPTFDILYRFDAKNSMHSPQARLTFSKDKKHIYGIAAETIYRINLDANPISITLLHQFDSADVRSNGSHPADTVVLSADEHYLYGITNGDASYSPHPGTIFRIDLTKNNFPFKTLYTFQWKNDGGRPEYLTINSNGEWLYGVTSYAGAFNCGTIFQYRLAPNDKDNYFHTLDHFRGCGEMNILHHVPNYLILSHDEKYLYGSVDGGPEDDFSSKPRGYVYRIATSGQGSLQKLYIFDKNKRDDFDGPALSLVLSNDDNVLYGSTTGYYKNHGTLFSLDLRKIHANPEKNILSKLYTFDPYAEDGVDGEGQGLLISQDNQKLYGTTIRGGTYKNGVIFEYTLPK